MNPAEVVMHVMQRNRVTVVLQFLAESVCQSRETPHRHPHGEVLALDKRCADVLGIGVAHYSFHFAADTSCGAIPRFIGSRCAINLMHLCVVNLRPKAIFDGPQIWSVCVCSDLRTANDAKGAILHKLVGVVAITSPNVVRDAELRVGINCRPGPRVAPAILLLLGRYVLFLGPDELPDFVTLQAANPHVADVAVMIRGTGAAHINKQFCDGVKGNSGHADDGAKGVSLDQRRNDPDLLVNA